MVFSSHLFFYYFLPVALGVYYLSPPRLRHLGLTLLSYVFYGWTNPSFALLLLASTLIDYVCGLVIAEARWGRPMVALAQGGVRTRRQKIALLLSIVSNLSLLGFFKYFGFATGAWDAMVTSLGAGSLAIDTTLRVTLPLGISFYTFQSMSYSIDVYRGQARALWSFVDFACYVSMFPQLVAGPILRFVEVEDQLRSRSHTLAKMARGVSLIALGMAKKILLANPCGKLADLAFAADSIHALDAWLGAIAYGFQIYFDFAGYSDMAIGLGLILGFTFPKNFDSPYLSRSITEFWRRWHLSLSFWLRDYLYLPLGGNRLGERRTYLNLGLVMVLGGLWHGAAFTFVTWGAFHGALLALERWRGKSSPYHALPAPVQVAITFALVTLGWVFFRSDSIGEAASYLGAMIGFGASAEANARLLASVMHQPYLCGTLVVAAGITWGAPQAWDFTQRLSLRRALGCLTLLAVSLVAMATQDYNPFIYFIF